MLDLMDLTIKFIMHCSHVKEENFNCEITASLDITCRPQWEWDGGREGLIKLLLPSPPHIRARSDKGVSHFLIKPHNAISI